MKASKLAPVAICFALLGTIACGGEASRDKPAVDDGVAAQLESSEALCRGQKPLLPASGRVTQTIAATREQTFRTDSSDHVYVSYEVKGEGLWLYLSFAPDLPASFTTAEARAAFNYAHIEYAPQQPPAAGANLILLDFNDALKLSDFERLEAHDGFVSFRLARTNAGTYRQRLSVEDLDPTVDPSLCSTGDIAGLCWCEFSGPATVITLDGTFPL